MEGTRGEKHLEHVSTRLQIIANGYRQGEYIGLIEDGDGLEGDGTSSCSLISPGDPQSKERFSRKQDGSLKIG